MDLEEYLKTHSGIRLVHFRADDSNDTSWQNNAEIRYTVNEVHPNGWWSVTTFPSLSGRYQGTNFNDALRALEEKTYRKDK